MGVNGIARKVKKGYVGVNGVARRIKKAYIGDENGKAKLCYAGLVLDPVFANNSWEQIIAACQENEIPSTWAVGDQKTMTINGTAYSIDIIGKNHDTYSDGSGTAPLTFQMHDCYTTNYKMKNSTPASNSGGWTNCDMRTSNLPTLLALMPNEVQSGIKEVNKLTSAGNQSTAINTTADKLFLLSEVEVFGAVQNSASGEGTQYAYFSTGNSKTKKRKGESSSTMWWLRSPDVGSTSRFCLVSQSGATSTQVSGGATGVAFAFCF